MIKTETPSIRVGKELRATCERLAARFDTSQSAIYRLGVLLVDAIEQMDESGRQPIMNALVHQKAWDTLCLLSSLERECNGKKW